MKSKLGWLPNAITLGNLTMGFVAILIASEVAPMAQKSMQFQPYVLAGFFILLAALFDGLDGMLARALDATSEIGADLDSLADLTTFGIAPGYLIYQMLFWDLKLDLFGKENLFPWGMLVAAIFPICAAYRLARFNVTHDPTSFQGLPSPVAGVIVGFLPMVLSEGLLPNWITIPGFVLVAILMVSNIRYSKPQMAIKEKYTPKRLVWILLGIACLMFLLWPKWPWLIYGLLFFYVFSGIISFIIHLLQQFRLKL